MLRADPDFLGSARSLLDALARSPSPDTRAAILNRVAKRLGDEWYPAFIKIACVIGESDDEPAKKLLADTLAHSMMKGDLPSGSLTSWGVSGNLPTPDLGAAPQGVPRSFFRAAPRRNLGPIEYLSSWHSQSTNRTPLSDDVYRTSLAGLLQLFNASAAAARAYQSKLQADSLMGLEGTYTTITRHRLAAIAAWWAEGVEAAEIAWRIVQLDRASQPGPPGFNAPV
jgi:hypothetical protein